MSKNGPSSAGRSPIEQARAYLGAVPGAVQGQNGSTATLRAARALVEGFELTDDAALALMLEWNPKCSPPWTQVELRHKIEDARKKSVPAKVGSKLYGSKHQKEFQDSVERWATLRGFSVSAVRALGGAAQGDTVIFPMFIGGVQVGVNSRKANGANFKHGGKTHTTKGGRLGLFLSVGARENIPAEATVYLTEGLPNAVALVDAGAVHVMGLPQAPGPDELLVEIRRLFQNHTGRIVLFGDTDTAGIALVNRVGESLAAINAGMLYVPGLPKKDLDVRLRGANDRSKELKRLVEGAMPWRPSKGAKDAKGERPEILISTNEATANDEIIDALIAVPALYQRGGVLVKIQSIEEPEGTRQRIMPIAPGDLRDLMTRCASFYTLKRPTAGNLGGDLIHVDEVNLVKVPAHPPAWCVSAVHQRGQWPHIRPLMGISACPVLTPSGRIAATAGYNEEIGMFLIDLPGVNVPTDPTVDQIDSARSLLIDLYADFPFETEAHRSGAVAPLFTVVGRPAIKGPVPIFTIDASLQASGKTLLADILGQIATGSDLPRSNIGRDEDEQRKAIATKISKGEPIVLIDNVNQELKGEALAAVATGTFYSSRILGKLEDLDLPIRTLFVITGNNLAYDADIARRVVAARLVPNVEKPEERSGFRHPKILIYAATHRAELLGAVLTILRGWWSAGCPDQGLPVWGSFERWSDIVRNAMVWAEWADPFTARMELAKSGNSDRDALLSVIESISMLDPNQRGMTASEILKAAGDGRLKPDLESSVISLATPPRSGKPSAVTLGRRLTGMRDRIISGRTLRRLDSSHGTIIWGVQSISTGGDSWDSGDDPPPLRTEDNINVPKGEKPQPSPPSPPESRMEGEDLGPDWPMAAEL